MHFGDSFSKQEIPSDNASLWKYYSYSYLINAHSPVCSCQISTGDLILIPAPLLTSSILDIFWGFSSTNIAFSGALRMSLLTLYNYLYPLQQKTIFYLFESAFDLSFAVIFTKECICVYCTHMHLHILVLHV